MLLRKHPLVTLSLLLALTGFLDATAVAQKKQQKVQEPEGPPPVVQLSTHPTIITGCADSAATDTQIPLTATTANLSGPALRYRWTTTGGRIIGDGPNATWDLTGAAPGTYSARVEVDNNRDDGCLAFTSTRVVVRPCPPPPVVCPNVSIYCPDTVTLGAPVTFTANISGGTPTVTPTYNWTISAGTIISGQGTPTIQVDTTGLAGQSINATVEVGGYNLDCKASCSVQIPRKISSNLVDRYTNIPRDDEKARLDNFAIQLQNEPSAKGYIVVYGGPRTNSAEKQKRIKRAQDYLVSTRGIDASRIVTMDGGSRDELAVELWVVPLGADPPAIR